MDPSLKPLITEFWVEYALGTAVMLVRFYARWKVAGFKNPQLDDWFIFLAFVSLEDSRVQSRIAP